MRIGCATWLLGADRLLDAVRAACDAGLTAVSFGFAPQERLSADEMKELARIVENHDLLATMHTAVGQKGDTEWPKVLQQRLALIREWHEETGRLACITFDPGSYMEGDVREFDLVRSAEILRATAETFVPLGVRVGIENGYWCLNTVERLKEFSEKAGPKVGMLLDIGHVNICSKLNGLDPAEYIGSGPLEIIEVHVHNNNGQKDEHLPIGEGNLDLQRTFTALKARGFDNIATLENTDFDTAQKAAESWRRCAGIFREGWG